MTLRLLILFGLAVVRLAAADPSEDSPRVVGHLFTNGEAASFSISTSTALHFVCRDHWNKIVAHGEREAVAGRAEIRLPTLPPGWYRLSFEESAAPGPIDFGVVLDRAGRAPPAAGRIGVDAASAWLLHNDAQRPVLARMLRLAGLSWVRERFSWSDTEPQRNEFDWRRYRPTIETLAAEGIRICEVWHDSPPWTRPAGSAANTPDDLREVYRWTRAAATRFRGQVQAWEPWNEMDIPPSWTDLGDRYAAALKAAYWGLKDGDPGATVAMGALAANPPGIFAWSFYESGGTDYADRFNWHIYTPPATYAGALAAHRALQRTAGAAVRPSWVTEAGILISGSAGSDRHRLDAPGREAQARFAAQSAVSSLAAGNERHFFFVLPDYLENGVQFGALQPDLSPYPSFLALSAAANLLGESTYLGAWPAPAGVSAHAFATPHGPVLALWSAGEQRLELPCRAASATVADLFGAPREIAATSGRITLPLSPDVTYVLAPDAALLAQVETPPPPPANSPAPPPSRIVVAGSAFLPPSKESNTYRIGGPDAPARFRVEAYNFDASASAEGEISLAVPSGWTISPDHVACRIEPLGRFVREVMLVAADVRDTTPRAVTVRGRFPGGTVAPSVSYFQRDLAGIPPSATIPLSWLPASRWRPEAAPVGTVTVSDIPDGLRLEARFSGIGDRWAYPVLRFDAPVDLSACDGIALTLAADAPTPNSWVRVMLLEPGGSAYMTGTQEFQHPHTVVFLFADMKYMGFSPADPDGWLDLSRIAAIKLGLNTPGDFMGVTVTGLRAVKFAASSASSVPASLP